MKRIGWMRTAGSGITGMKPRNSLTGCAMILAMTLMAGTGWAADFNVTVFNETENTSPTDDPVGGTVAGTYRDAVEKSQALEDGADRILWSGVNGGILDLTSNVSYSGDLDINVNTIGGAGLNVTSSAIGGSLDTFAFLTGSSNVSITGDEILTLEDATLITGANTLLITETATLLLNNTDNVTQEHLSNDVAVVVDAGAAFTLSNDTETIGSLSGAGMVNMQDSDLLLGSTNTSTTFSGAFASFFDTTSNITKTGTNQFTLTGDSVGYTGTMSVAGGALQIDGAGTVGGNVLVDAGATLWGFGGTINGNLGNSGTVAPGNGTAIGTLNIGGNYNQTNAGTLAINVDNQGNSDQLLLTGATSEANLEGALTLNVASPAASTDLLGTSLSIVSAPNVTTSNVTGTFDTITHDMTFLNANVAYNTNGVSVTFSTNSAAFQAAATTDNERAVATAFEQVFAQAGLDADAREAFNTFIGKRGSDATEALREMAGESRASAISGNIQAGIATTGRLLAQLASIRSGVNGVKPPSDKGRQYSDAGRNRFGPQYSQTESAAHPSMPTFGNALGLNGLMANAINGTHAGGRWSGDEKDQVWLLGLGYWGDLDAKNSFQGSQYTGGGFMVGRTWTLGDNWIAGLHGGYNTTDITTPFSQDNSEVKTFNVGGHGSYTNEEFYLDMLLNVSLDNYDNRRFLTQFARNATGDYDGSQVSLYGEAGWVLRIDEEPDDSVDGWFWQPQLATQYRHVGTDSYTESGAGSLNLNVAENDLNLFQTALGVKIFNVTELEEGGWLVPDVQLRWGHEFGDIDRQITSSFTGTTPTFVVNGRPAERDTLQVRAGIAGYDVLTMDFDVSYNGSFASGQQDHAAMARFIRRF